VCRLVVSLASPPTSLLTPRLLTPPMLTASLVERIEAAAKKPKLAPGLQSYKYRDPVKRRAQVAAAMRKWRARKARRGGVGSG
jgi:hypothetical protein